MPLLKYVLGNYLFVNARKYLIFVSFKVCDVLGIMGCFLLQACVFGNAVQVLWFGRHRKKQGLAAQL